MTEIMEFLRSDNDSNLIERGPRYDVYAKLRESNLQSKRLKLYDFETVLPIPNLENSPPVKKIDEIHESFGGFEEDYRVLEQPKSPILRRSSRNLGNSAIPKPGFLTRSMKFSSIPGVTQENEQICEIPRSEYSPIQKKSMKFQRKTEQKQGYSALAQSVPNFSSALRKENRKPAPEIGNINRIPKGGKCVTPPVSRKTKESVYGSGVKYGGGSTCLKTGDKQSNVNARGIIGRKSYATVEELKGLSIIGENKRTRKSTLFTTKYY